MEKHVTPLYSRGFLVLGSTARFSSKISLVKVFLIEQEDISHSKSQTGLHILHGDVARG